MKGSYALVLLLSANRELTIGKLGRFSFPSGCYLYFGSALNGLESRLKRHLRPDKKLHWHIDYLSRPAWIVQVWWTLSETRQECVWSQSALIHPGAITPVRGFGATDCRHCLSHLIYLPSLELAGKVLESLRLESADEIVHRNTGVPAILPFLGDNHLV
ncbi:MAG TPA: GIY-YIG nuclease family protein [Dehalococcoidia bacterium]|nr:GIY-YIG nuclease family protein [Dehalococcoidia bacterium]